MELYLLVGLAAVVVCFLKGRPIAGSAVSVAGVALVAVLAVRGDASGGDVSGVSRALMVFGFPAWAVLAVAVALRPARPLSFWDRRSAVDPSGRRLLDAEPMTRRRARAAVGAVPSQQGACPLESILVTAV